MLRLTYGFASAGQGQFHLVTQRREMAAPMMRRTASLHRHHAGCESPKNSHRSAPKLASDDDLALRVDAVNLKHVFARSSPIRMTLANFSVDFAMDGFPSDGLMTTTILAV